MIAVWHILLFGFFCALLFGVPTFACIWQDRDYRRRKRAYEEERARSAAEFRLHLMSRMREVQSAVERQKQDQPAVSVPVTLCERQERRRVIKLYE